MKFTKTLPACLVALGLSFSAQVQAVSSKPNSLTMSTDVLRYPVLKSCSEYAITGMCLWLKCVKPFGCIVLESIRVKHYIPEVAVSVYNRVGETPWTEMKHATQMVQETVKDTMGITIGDNLSRPTQKAEKGRHISQTTKHAEAIGHPSDAMLNFLSQFSYVCRPQALPFVPYYLSGLDILSWTPPPMGGMVTEIAVPTWESKKGLMPGNRELKHLTAEEIKNGNEISFSGSMDNIKDNVVNIKDKLGNLGDWAKKDTSQMGNDNWGNIYPRTGIMTQVHDYKASALGAQRVADFLTREWQMHLLPFGALAEKTHKNTGRWTPGAVKEGNDRTHKWRMLYPKKENQCNIFPDRGRSFDDTYSDKISPGGNYTWELWRPYECCQKKGSKLIDVLEFEVKFFP